MNRFARYLQTLRESNEKTKRRAVAVATALTMLLVIFLWVVYLNFTLPSLNTKSKDVTVTNADTSESASTDTAPTDTSFLGTIGRGFSIIGDEIGGQLSTIGREISTQFSRARALTTKKNEVTITPKPIPQSQATTTESLPPATLPQ